MNRLTRTARARAALGAIGVLLAALLLAIGAHAVHVAPAPRPASASSERAQPSTGLTSLLGAGDGQAYAAIARDPTLARPGALTTKPEFAYRAQRPLFGEIGWALSFGDPKRVPIALATLAALAAGLAVVALGQLLARRDVAPHFALGIFVVPAAIGIIWGMTPELLELALITFGLLAWTANRRGRCMLAVAAFTLAALTRESMLLVPVVLVLLELRRDRSFATARRLAPLLIPFAAYGAWITLVRVRVGDWPWSARSDRLTLIPFSGLAHAIQHSSDGWTSLAWIAIGLLVTVSALTLGRRDEWYATMCGFLALAPFLGSDVWRRPADFGRVLLPVSAYGAVLVLDALRQRTRVARPTEVARLRSTPA